MSAPAPASRAAKSFIAARCPGLAEVRNSQTRRYLFARGKRPPRSPRHPRDWLKLRGVTRNNLDHLDVDIPLGVFTSVTGISGSGKSSLISQFLVEAVGDKLGQRRQPPKTTTRAGRGGGDAGRRDYRRPRQHQAAGGGGPEADRPDAAVEPCDVYRTLRSCPQAVCGHQAGSRQAVRCGPLFVQCREGPVRDLPRGRIRLRRTALFAERLCALSDLQGRALQRQDA